MPIERRRLKSKLCVPDADKLKQALWDAAVDYHVADLLRRVGDERYGPPYDEREGREQVTETLVRYSAAAARVQEAVQGALTVGVLYGDVADGSYFRRVEAVFQARRRSWAPAAASDNGQ